MGVQLLSAILTLFLIMDPIGNVPLFLSYLKDVDERRRPKVVARESLIALAILVCFLLFGPILVRVLHIGVPSLHIAGGVLLFLIALGMIFPGIARISISSEDQRGGEPFIVPLATPFVAGPSTIATLMVFVSKEPQRLWEWLTALVVAWVLTTTILMLSSSLSRLLGPRGLVACERLMGMILTVVSVQMLLDGIGLFMASLPS
jgi:multiple antibiotic resistance protein